MTGDETKPRDIWIHASLKNNSNTIAQLVSTAKPEFESKA